MGAQQAVCDSSSGKDVQKSKSSPLSKSPQKGNSTSPQNKSPKPLTRSSVQKRSRDPVPLEKSGKEASGPLMARKLAPLLEHGVSADQRIIVIGDLHGMLHKVKALWRNLEDGLGRETMYGALVLFLGDYCDRGQHTKQLIEWLCCLQRDREQAGARTVFLLGNHEFCLLGFLGLLPKPEDNPDFAFRQTWDRDTYALNKEKSRLWGKDKEPEEMEDVHLQGRRWAGPFYEKSYGSAATFASYKADRGDRSGLLRAMPQEHIDFLVGCPWIHIEENALVGKCIFVHAGLEADGSEDCEAQIARIKAKDASLSQPESLFGRDGVLHTPPQLARRGVTVISGHHGKVLFRTHRIILDSCCGDERNQLAGLILPEGILVTEDGGVERREANRVFSVRARMPSLCTIPLLNSDLGTFGADSSASTSEASNRSNDDGSVCSSSAESSPNLMPAGDFSPLEVAWSGGDASEEHGA